MIDVTLLGTSALLPIPERALTAAAMFCGGHSILFDCGEGTQTAARRHSVSLMKTDIIALTHYHGDHVFGIPGLLLTMHNMGRTEPLYIMGPEGLSEAMAPLMTLVGAVNYEIRFISAPYEGLRLCDLIDGWPVKARLTAFKTEHRVSSCGYAFTLDRAGKFLPEKAVELGVPTRQWKVLQSGESVTVGDDVILPEAVLGEARRGLKFVFSGDTCACESLVNAARGADLFICEATYGENEQAELAIEHGHMNFAQAARVASDAEVKKLWLAHYSQMIKDTADYLPLAADIFPNTVCGEDGMSVTLRFEE